MNLQQNTLKTTPETATTSELQKPTITPENHDNDN